MGAASKGALVTAGIRKGATWGTAILVGANQGILIKSSSMLPKVKFVPNESLDGKLAELPGDVGIVDVGGDLIFEGQFESLDLLWALVMGTDTQTIVGAGPAYKHVMKVSNDVFGLFATLVLDYQTEVWEFQSCKVKSFKLEIDSKSVLAKLTFSIRADYLNRNTGSGTNKTSTIASITRINTNYARILWSQMQFRMNAQAGAGLGAGDAQVVEKLSLEVGRKFKEDDYTTAGAALGTIDEPQDDGQFSVKLSMGFSRYDSANQAMARVADLFTKAQNKASIVFTSATKVQGDATNFYSLSIYLNALQLMDGAPPIPGQGMTPFSVNLEAHLVQSVPTGFPAGYTDPIDIELVDSLSTGALA